MLALNVLEGAVLGRCRQPQRYGEFIRLLNSVEAAVPAGKTVNAIFDNYSARKHPNVRTWLASPRTFRFPPISAR